MRKKILNFSILLILFFSLLNLAYLAYAQEKPEPPLTSDVIQRLTGCTGGMSLSDCLTNIGVAVFRVLALLVFIYATIQILLAGYAYIKKGGDEKERAAVAQRLIYGVLGLVVALLAWAIAAFVGRIITSGGITI